MKSVGFLLSRHHSDLIHRIIRHRLHIRHLKMAIQWYPVMYQESENLEAESYMDLDTIASLFVNLRTLEFFMGLHRHWHPHPIPCMRASVEIVREIARIMRSSAR
jgi:hypothetical protein